MIIVTTADFSLYLFVATSGNPSVQMALQRDCSQLWWYLAGFAAVIIVATAVFSLFLCVATSGNPLVQTTSQRDCSQLWCFVMFGLGGIKPVVTCNNGIRANLDGGPCTGHGSMLYAVVDCCQ